MKLDKEQIKSIINKYDLESIMDLEEDARNDEINDIILECLNYEKVEPFTEEWDNLYSQYEDIVINDLNRAFVTIKLERIYEDLNYFLFIYINDLSNEQFKILYDLKKALINLKKGEQDHMTKLKKEYADLLARARAKKQPKNK